MTTVVYDIETLPALPALPASVYAPYIPKMTYVLSESQLHGAQYHIVQPIFANWKELESWAIETYGESSDIWETNCGRWYYNDSRLWFRNEEDVSMFVLKWG